MVDEDDELPADDELLEVESDFDESDDFEEEESDELLLDDSELDAFSDAEEPDRESVR